MIMQKSGKTRIIINAFGAPHIAVKYEAEIGKLMVKQAKSDGQSGRIPSNAVIDQTTSEYYKQGAEKNRLRVLETLDSVTLMSAREIAAACGLSRETVVAVIQRLKAKGEVVGIPRGHYHIYRKVESCGTHHE